MHRPPRVRYAFHRFREIITVSCLRFVPKLAGALSLFTIAAAAQPTPILGRLASFNCSGVYCLPSVGTLSVSPNGRFVAQGTETHLRMHDVASGQSWNLAEGWAWQLSWSPRGDMIAYVAAGPVKDADYVWVIPVDPSTGKARGHAQRVTIGESVSPSLSPDGRWIAFSAIDSGGNAQHLALVPAMGGPERVLARGPGLYGRTLWGANSATIYVEEFSRVSAPRVSGIRRIHVEAGTSEVIRSLNERLAGMSADRRHLVLVPGKPRVDVGDQAIVIDTTGREVGRAALPVDSEVGPDVVLGDSALVWVSGTSRRRLEMRPVSGGSARRLPLIGESSDVPLWSPDGKRIAFQVREGGRTSIAVIDADGTKLRVFREAQVLPQQWGMDWSPDSRFIAFQSSDRQTLSVLDVADGKALKIAEDSAGRFGAMQWRADGKAVLFAVPNSGDMYRGSIDEVTLNGKRRQLMPMVNVTGFSFVGGTSAFLRTDSAAFLRPLDTGRVRRLDAVPKDTRVLKVEVSSDRQWVFGVMGNFKRIEMFSTESGERAVLEVPFTLAAVGIGASFLPNNRSFLVFGRRAGEETTRILRVPLNGEAPHSIADVGGEVRWMEALSVSPDGKSVVYPVQHAPPTQSLVLIDLRRAIPRAPSRPPRD